ncbi:hypothetical protein MC885_012730, partial [Smutsia gigantea]
GWTLTGEGDPSLTFLGIQNNPKLREQAGYFLRGFCGLAEINPLNLGARAAGYKSKPPGEEPQSPSRVPALGGAGRPQRPECAQGWRGRRRPPQEVERGQRTGRPGECPAR